MKIIYEKEKNFNKKFNNLLLSRDQYISQNVDKVVKKIINDVKINGDKALIKLSNKYDKLKIKNKKDLFVNTYKMNNYAKKIQPNIFKNFKIAINRIKIYHNKQLPKNYSIIKNGIKLHSKWKPIDSVGLYIPGGEASYPSSLLMNIIPAKIAGVKRIVIVTPSNKGNFNPYVMAILKYLKIKEIYQIGGAQAIAALAYGTKVIKPVDKIFGPGNSFVASAKKQVFGKVGVDLIAGPSEVLVVADKNNNPEWVACDLIAQAEHDESAQSILITNNKFFASKVIKYIDKYANNLSRKNIIKKSMKRYGSIIILKSLKNAHTYINKLAPEHLHLQSKNRNYIYTKVINAGAIFLGEYSTESIGDYIAGTNHILPTGRTSRFSSGLGVLDFMKRISSIEINKKGFKSLSNSTEQMAEVEGLYGHKLSVQIRKKKYNI